MRVVRILVIPNLKELQRDFEKRTAQQKEMQEELMRLNNTFKEKFSREKLSSITIDQYVPGRNNTNSFCHWLEHQTKNLGSIGIHGAREFGIYFSKKDNSYKVRKGITSEKINKPEAEATFEKIKKGILELLHHAEENNIEKVKEISNELTLTQVVTGKILSLYFPDKYLNVFSNTHADQFLNRFGLLNDETRNLHVIDKRKLLSEIKQKDNLMKTWSNRKYADFLYKMIFQARNGYIINTHPQWFKQNIENQKSPKDVVFWGKRNRLPSRSIKRGTTIFFRITGEKPPIIRGYATVKATELLRLTDAWEKYGISLGYQSMEEMIKTGTKFKGTVRLTSTSSIYCIIMENQVDTIPLSTTTDLLSLRIEFDALHVVTGKRLYPAETSRLLRFTEARKTDDHPGTSHPPTTSLQHLSAITFIPESVLGAWENMLNEKKQMIFYGPPGTGKTFVAKKFGECFIRDGGKTELVQFHPSYSYEDFVEGIRPKVTGSSNITYEYADGILKKLCADAVGQRDKKFVLVIDEINRGNLAKIFGELIHCLEYRGENHKILLPYSQEYFYMPENVYILGTMNSADRSIALVDYALRRRFNFIEFLPDQRILSDWLDKTQPSVEKEKVIELLRKVNQRVRDDEKLGKHFLIGHSYFMHRNLNKRKLEEIWKFNIIPLLEEYYFEDDETIKEFRKVYDGLFPSTVENVSQT